MGGTLEPVEQILARPHGIEALRLRSFSFPNLLSPDMWGDSTGHTVLCPVCQHDYVHVTSSGDVGEYDILHFAGECGHRFAFVFQFHKGNTSVYVVREPDRSTVQESNRSS